MPDVPAGLPVGTLTVRGVLRLVIRASCAYLPLTWTGLTAGFSAVSKTVFCT